jgi:streptogramin lyase
MNDFERRMRESLKSVGESYRPSDPHEAKQEFFRRRRRRTVWMWTGATVAVGAAAALGFLAFVIVGTPSEQDRGARTITPAVSQRNVDLGRIEVGNGPDGIAVGEGYVWVVNGESQSLSRIDPATGAVEPVDASIGEQPEDVLVAHGSVWVTDRGTGDIYRYDVAAQEMEPATTIGSGEDLDVAAGEASDIWIAHAGGQLYRLDAEGTVIGSWPVAEKLTDVSFIDSEAWVYDEATGFVVRFDPDTQASTARAHVGSSESADLVAGLRYVWFYRGSDGKLLQIDRQTARVVKRFELGGTFGSLTIGEDSLWAMVTEGGAEGSGNGRLYRIDVDDALEIQEPIPVSDTPYDIAAGYGSVWATNFTADQITRVDLEAGGTQPTVAETPSEDAVFYYSDGQDILAIGDDSDVALITETEAAETSPAMSAASNALAFQRFAHARPEIIGLDLDAGREVFVATGSVPAVGPDGRIAYAREGTSESNPTAVVVSPLSELDVIEIEIPGQPGPPMVDRIAWDPGGAVLYVQTSYEGTEIAAIDLTSSDPQPMPIAPERMQEGSVLVAPSAREPGVLTAIRLCCADPPEFDFTTAELVEIAGDPTSGWGPAQKVIGIDDVLSPDLELFAVPAGNLDFENDRGWSSNGHRAWLVGDGEQLYLMDESGEKDLIPVSGVTGVAVNPAFTD